MIIKRCEDNPVLKPNRKRFWEAQAVFNGCPVKKGSKTYLLYRAMSLPYYHTPADKTMMISSIGIAESDNGIDFNNRRRFIIPEKKWEIFGCEDPRVTKINNKYYTFYTALSKYPFTAEGIKVGVAISKDLKKVDTKHLVTPFNAKGMSLFPEKINNKLYAVLTVNTDKPPSKICIASFDKEEDLWNESRWMEWYEEFEEHSLNLQRSSEDHIEAGAPPVKTKHGWLLLYSYIRNYHTKNPFFGVEAVLLDLKDPSKIIARITRPILTPEEYYEKIGMVPNIVFPSGSITDKNWIHLYYGAADTTCCRVNIEKNSLLNYMLHKRAKLSFERFKNNPIIEPIKEHDWESKATFNPAAIKLNNEVHILYRAMSEDNTSVLGYAKSEKGFNIDYRSSEPVYTPRKSFEEKAVCGGNSGCEDPRLTLIDDTIYMLYTAFNGASPPKVAITSIKKTNFLKQEWNWTSPKIISPPHMDDKDACLFPEKINDKYYIIHRTGHDMDLAIKTCLDFKEGEWIEDLIWLKPRKGWWDSKKVGLAAPPIKVNDYWLVLYHGVSEDSVYRVGAVLLDYDNPFNIIARTDHPLFEPETYYEKEGIVPNVVFPCGAVVVKDELLIYYGGGDKVTGGARIKLKKLVDELIANRLD